MRRSLRQPAGLKGRSPLESLCQGRWVGIEVPCHEEPPPLEWLRRVSLVLLLLLLLHPSCYVKASSSQVQSASRMAGRRLGTRCEPAANQLRTSCEPAANQVRTGLEPGPLQSESRPARGECSQGAPQLLPEAGSGCFQTPACAGRSQFKSRPARGEWSRPGSELPPAAWRSRS